MFGLILSGGQSSRMGTDKGLLPSGNGTWIEHSYALLSSLNIPVKISVNEQQLAAYQKVVPGADFIIDEKELNIGGPLKGLMSAHHQFPGEDIFVLACDMQRMQPNVLRTLVSASLEKNHAAYIYQNGAQAEPLCGIYTAKAMQQIDSWYNANDLPKHGLISILLRLKIPFLSVPENWQPFFENFNSPDDIQKMPL
ncbi:molybdenum cofactor guanylyltransferase [Taibaiella soli]|uniref:MobA-like NTP transferase domain-containing protein n=1 Tax=Taibaiella soli TaxID=1649169 RepID=A0A2W2B2M5_9BACT|nr:molybdenum cofactor guanylyltransferase [Taibaiella soli]PZF74534.1 hypothetical protein DN068_02870 [Taibaiella soli]